MRAGRLLPLAVNWLWLQNSYAGNRRFSRALENPGPTQELYLKNLLRRNESTQYGRANHFSQISSIRDFQENIPLTRYEDYLPYIEEISRGKSSVLTHDPVALFQPTSGTSSASKLIPYNQPLKAEYQMAISPWVYNLFRRVPGLMRGRAYWSISPPVERDKFHGCIPVGFDDDSEYLGGIGKRLYNLVSVGRQKFTPDISLDDFRDRTLTSLLAARNLALISVWSPTLLLTLIKHFLENQGRLIEVLASSGSPDARARAGNIRWTIQKHGLNFKAIWPDLKLISCWTHGASEPFIPEIRRYFPGTEIQGKGLVATEAFVSLPLLPDNDPVLAVNSHFFEFRDIETGKIRLAHELDRGGVYSVIVTTGGGLYRYEMDDLVRVTGFIAATPALRFISKNAVSDIFGEKLNAEHVQRSLAVTFAEYSLNPTFFFVAPTELPGGRISYTLFFESENVSDEQGRMLREKLEGRFLENFHYAYCRKLGQLGHLEAFLIDCSSVSPEVAYLGEMHRRGLKLGDIKPSVLDRETGWEKRFQGRFMATDYS